MRAFLERLAARRLFGIRPGLETMHKLCEALGHPEQDCAVIHIAGTNGKGSVAAICEAALRTMGLPVGRYTSPHLIRVNERFLVHGEPVSDEALSNALDEVERVCAEHALEPTFFEVLTACAWVIFRQAGCKIVVCETGMGGRWDATNVITEPLVSVITRVALDHCAILGDTVEAIAAEKAGIIKPGCPVVIGQMDPRARAVIEHVAQTQQAPLRDAAAEVRVTVSRRTVHGQTLQCTTPTCDYPAALTRLAGSYQVINAATALTTLEALESRGICVPPKAFTEALRTVDWPARCQLLSDDPPVFLDGGHNPDGLKALRESLKSMHIRKRVALVCGFCKDKAVIDALKEIAPLVSCAWTVPVATERTMTPAETAAAAQAAGISPTIPMETVADALEAATTWAQDCQGTVVICGSLYLAGEVLALRDEAGDFSLDPGELPRGH